MSIPHVSRPFSFTRLLRASWAGLCVLLLAACHWDMYDQPRVDTYEPSAFFEDGRGARAPVAGAVALGEAQTDTYFYTGLIDGVEGDVLPFPVTQELLLRGQAQYDIYCATCHGRTGYGEGMIAQRGGIVPANLHQEYLREAPIGHYFNVITNGYRLMYGYASRITPEDRWAIAAYVRALQLSQNATLDDVPAEERANLGNE
jgi:mono/diheme cytochrome c family protein